MYYITTIIILILGFGGLAIGGIYMETHYQYVCTKTVTIQSLYQVANGNYLNTRTYIYKLTDGNLFEEQDGELHQYGDVLCVQTELKRIK